MKNGKLLLISSLLLVTPLLGACNSNNDNQNVSYDGRVYDLSEKQDKSLIATSTKNGYNYDLVISGSGDGVDYTSSKSVPWYAIAKKITNITIENGIEYIGDYYFSSIAIDYLVLPSSVIAVGKNTFSANTVVYTYGETLTNISNSVYQYSEARPTKLGNYFYLDENNTPAIWPKTLENPSVLFIGNSFTFRQGSVDDPSVPRYFQKIAENLGQKTTIDFVVASSYYLSSYADANDTLGSIVDSKIKSNSYDYIILQEQSTRPLTNYQLFEDAVKSLKEKIDKNQSSCEVILYETWGSPASYASCGYSSVEAMEAGLRSAYEKCANTNNCSINYIGKAFTYAYVNQGINIYADDNRHQSELGAYFSASCHVRSMFKLNVSSCTDYCGFNESECKTLLGITDKII